MYYCTKKAHVLCTSFKGLFVLSCKDSRTRHFYPLAIDSGKWKISNTVHLQKIDVTAVEGDAGPRGWPRRWPRMFSGGAKRVGVGQNGCGCRPLIRCSSHRRPAGISLIVADEVDQVLVLCSKNPSAHASKKNVSIYSMIQSSQWMCSKIKWLT